MLQLTEGDILKSDAEALVNTVNCVGIMGRGIALQFKKRFPENFKQYKAACDAKELHPGEMFVHETGDMTNPRWIINFPTKRHWRQKSRMEDIEPGLAALRKEIEDRKIRSIAIPPLGCGLGGLNWPDVRKRIEAALADLEDVDIRLYEPKGAPEVSKMTRTRKAPNMTAAPAVLIELMRRYQAALMDPFVTLLEIHKLMYLMQEAGQGLKLRYAKGPYGPYAENLRHVLSNIEGHFISGYADGEDAPEKEIELKDRGLELADKLLTNSRGEKVRFERVSDLIEGFETPFGMELLTTVHWVCNRESASSLDDCIRQVHAWNPRKRMFQKEHIETAWDVLHEKGWVN